jgi:hypothetical protein
MACFKTDNPVSTTIMCLFPAASWSTTKVTDECILFGFLILKNFICPGFHPFQNKYEKLFYWFGRKVFSGLFILLAF